MVALTGLPYDAPVWCYAAPTPLTLKRLCSGERTFNAQRGLIENLNSITDSLIWSAKKSSDRAGIMDFAQSPDESGDWNDPLATKPSDMLSAAATLIQDEQCETQRKCFEMLKASFDGDKDTQDYLDALSLGYFDIEDISTLTGMPVTKIYEIRRKLKKCAPRFFGVSNFSELERKIKDPQE